MAVEEGLTPGQAGVGAGAPQEGRGSEAGALLTGSRSRHSGLSWQRAKKTAQVGHSPSPGRAQGSTPSRDFRAGDGAGWGPTGQKGLP